MTHCVEPGSIQEWELEAYANGERHPHVIKHLKICQACRLWVKERREVEAALRHTLYRFDCPTPDVLREYYWDTLPDEQQTSVARHLEACPACQRELAKLQQFMAEGKNEVGALLDKARQIAEGLRVMVARLIQPDLQPLAPALRGKKDAVLLFEAGDFGISLTIKPEEAHRYTLTGQVLLPEPLKAEPAGYVHINGPGIEPHLTQMPLSPNGTFEIAKIPEGHYQLAVTLGENRIIVLLPPLTQT